MTTELTTTEAAIVESLEAGKSRRETAERLNIDVSSLNKRIRLNATLAEQVEQAEKSASHMVLEEIRNIPNLDVSPARARVSIEALRTYLELRFPARYGKQINMNVRTVDLTGALNEARERARRAIPGVAQRVATDDALDDELAELF